MEIIKEKAKAYDEAFERVKELLSRCRTNRDRRTMVYRVEDIESIFPELKKSEDEKIKEDLIQWISEFPDMIWSGHYKEDIIKWLERQGEQKQDVNVQISPSEYVNDMGGNGCYLKNATQTSTWSKKEEKVDKQNCVKSVDDIKPKFKVGDWISNDMCDVHIASIEDGMYYFDEGDGLSIVFVDERYHIWTIEDAMDGDVLAFDDETIVIFKDLYNKTSFHSYCHIEDGVFNISKDDMPDWWEGEGFYPATRKQRDLLFQKMKEAGYIFDFKNKEFKKIETEIEIPFGAKDSELQEATYHIPKGFYAEIDNDKVVIKKGEKPTAWSKKDEKMFEYALNMIEWYSGKNEDKSRYVSDWLKSLKQRIGG